MQPFMKFGMRTQMGPLQRIVRKNFEFLKIQDGGGCYLENHKNRDISATVWPIFTKFGMMVQNGFLNLSDRYKIEFQKSKTVDSCHSENRQITIYICNLYRFWLNLAGWCMLVPSAWRKVQFFYRAMLCIRGTNHGPVSVCPSVCPSVTSRCSTKTAKRRITQITPHDSTGTLVFWCQRSPRNSTAVTPYEGAECRWGGSKSATFGQ